MGNRPQIRASASLLGFTVSVDHKVSLRQAIASHIHIWSV